MADFNNKNYTNLAISTQTNFDAPIKNKKVYVLLGKNDEPKGEFIGSHPKQAAKKAFTRIIRKHLNNQIKENNGVSEEISFKIKEKKTGKVIEFSGMRVRLENPKKVNHNGKIVTYKFKNVVARTE